MLACRTLLKPLPQQLHFAFQITVKQKTNPSLSRLQEKIHPFLLKKIQPLSFSVKPKP